MNWFVKLVAAVTFVTLAFFVTSNRADADYRGWRNDYGYNGEYRHRRQRLYGVWRTPRYGHGTYRHRHYGGYYYGGPRYRYWHHRRHHHYYWRSHRGPRYGYWRHRHYRHHCWHHWRRHHRCHYTWHRIRHCWYDYDGYRQCRFRWHRHRHCWHHRRVRYPQSYGGGFAPSNCQARIEGAATGQGIFGRGTQVARAAAIADFENKAATTFGSEYASFSRAYLVRWECTKNSLIRAKCVVTAQPCR